MAYVVDQQLNAIGVSMPMRKRIHGKTIPSDTICVLVNYAVDNIPAPIVLGDVEENSKLKAGMFFALPVRNLFYYSYSPSSNNVKLSPFSV